jgi:two-component system sensor histidine kinase CpxA
MKSIAFRLFLIAFLMRISLASIDLYWGNGDILKTWSIPYATFVIVSWFSLVMIDVGLPMKKIYQAMNRFKAGEFDMRINMKRKDEIGLIAETFNELADRVQSLIESERRMTANLAHEIRIPLTRMAFLLDKLDCNVKSEPTRDKLRNEIVELSVIAQQLLKLAQIERHEFKPYTEPINLNELIMEYQSRLQYDFESKSLTCIFEQNHEAWAVGDRNLLNIAILNILENAIRYTKVNSSIIISIDMTVDNKPDHLKISVRDQGSGVPAEDLERIFLPFERSDPSRDRQTGGAGLGLSLAKSIVECQNGTIQAKNLPDGFEVSIHLPIAKPDSL